MKKYLFVLVFIPYLFSCQKETENMDIGYSYYVAEPGYYLTYMVDSIYFDDFYATSDTNYFLIKELIESSFIDNEGRQAYRIERWYKYNDTLPWVLKNVWYSVKTNKQIERVEENIRYIKLIFPIKNYAKWNGNALNNLDYQEYKYLNAHKPFNISDFAFDSTVKVQQDSFINLKYIRYKYEIYAKNVGLIKKVFINLENEDNMSGKIKNGVKYEWRLIDYGKE